MEEKYGRRAVNNCLSILLSDSKLKRELAPYLAHAQKEEKSLSRVPKSDFDWKYSVFSKNTIKI